jgi:hypothetical protein
MRQGNRRLISPSAQLRTSILNHTGQNRTATDLVTDSCQQLGVTVTPFYCRKRRVHDRGAGTQVEIELANACGESVSAKPSID